jgi:hypothetical protein
MVAAHREQPHGGMNMDWINNLKTYAPAAAALVGGPLWGGAVKLLIEATGGKASGDAEFDETVLANTLTGTLTPEVRAAMIEADKALRLEAMKTAVEEKRIDADVDKAHLLDRQNARGTHGGDRSVMVLGTVVLLGWVALTGVTLFGLYCLLTKGIDVKDVGTVATAFTILGSIMGYVSNSAQQVLGYYFGTSRGSEAKTHMLAGAVSSAVPKKG